MKETRDIMDIHATVEIFDEHATQFALDKIFDYFTYIDETFNIFRRC